MKKYKVVEIASALGIGLISFILSNSLKLALIITVLSLVLFIIYSPEKRYWRAFWYILVGFITTSGFSFKFIKLITNGNFEIKYEENNIVTIILGVLLIMLPILDYLERNRLKKKPKIKIKGNNNLTFSEIKDSEIKIRKDA